MDTAIAIIATITALYSLWRFYQAELAGLSGKKSSNGYWYWLVADIVLCLLCVKNGQYVLSFLFVIYGCIAIILMEEDK